MQGRHDARRSADGTPTRSRRSGGSADKRRAVLAGALTIFARDGYTRASMDAIAAQAGVSTRTIYNHFLDKADLFQQVITDSAGRVAEAQSALIESHLRRVTDLEADLIEFGRAWLTPVPDYAEHSDLVRQVNAETGHIPPAAIEAWQDAGPRRVLGELADRFTRLAEHGLLRLEDPARAARHFAVLITVPNPSLHGSGLGTEETAEMVAAGVRAFLHGYQA